MSYMKLMFKWLWVGAALLAVAATARVDFQAVGDGHALGPSQTATATPLAARAYELCPGDDVGFPLHVYLPPAPIQADIVFAFDTTLSMDDVIQIAQAKALAITSNLQDLIADVRFGVVDFRDYPREPYGNTGDWPYALRQPLTHNTDQIQAAIEALEAGGGSNLPEAYSRALYEIQMGDDIGWRPDARQLIVMFGDSVAHDDDLNAGVPEPQPYLPGEPWQPGDYPPPHLDPGRDGEPGTPDDLDFQTVLGQLANESISLLFIQSNETDELGPGPEDLLVYWRVWSGMTAPGGDARALEDVADLPGTIQELVAAAGAHIDHLGVSVAPTWFEAWVTVLPSSYEDLDIPPAGLNRDFEVQIAVPAQIPAGRYTIVLLAEAGGTVYDRQQATVNVPDTCFATPTPTATYTPTVTPVPSPTPRPIWHTFLPLVANNRVNWRP
jgi:hypothetical protein